MTHPFSIATKRFQKTSPSLFGLNSFAFLFFAFLFYFEKWILFFFFLLLFEKRKINSFALECRYHWIWGSSSPVASFFMELICSQFADVRWAINLTSHGGWRVELFRFRLLFPVTLFFFILIPPPFQFQVKTFPENVLELWFPYPFLSPSPLSPLLLCSGSAIHSSR